MFADVPEWPNGTDNNGPSLGHEGWKTPVGLVPTQVIIKRRLFDLQSNPAVRIFLFSFSPQDMGLIHENVTIFSTENA